MRARALAVAALAPLAVLATFTAAGAQPPPPPGSGVVKVSAGATQTAPDIALQYESGALTGHVVDAQTGKPAGGQYVEAVDAASGRVGGLAPVEDGGKYTIARLPAAKAGYYVCSTTQVSRDGPLDGYPNECYPGVGWDGKHVPHGATAIPLSSGATHHVPRFRIDEGGYLLGHVRTIHGNGLIGVPVYARSLSQPRITYALTGRHGTTRRSGRYVLGPLPPSKKGWVVCFDPRQAQAPDAKTNPDGYLPSCYRHRAWSGRGVPQRGSAAEVAPGHVAKHIDGVALPGGSVAGTVRPSSGKVPEDTTVTLYGPHHRKVGSEFVVDGNYHVVGLPRLHKVTVCAPVIYAAVHRPYEPAFRATCVTKKVEVRPSAQAAGPNIVAPRGGVVTGTVTEAASGDPVGGVPVEVYARGGRALPSLTVHTHDDGSYRLSGLPPSKAGYILCVATAAHGSTLRFVAPQCSGGVAWDGARADVPPTAERVPVTASSSRHTVSFSLPSGGALQGTVEADTGAAGNNHVFVFTKSGALVLDSSRTNADGKYFASGLAPGNYRLCVLPAGYGKPLFARYEYGRCLGQTIWPD
jgi:5-hydroxyisourate hydrolase-like protein (transthyretin family)